MARYIALFVFYSLPIVLYSQKPSLLELKMTPTSILNLTKPNLLVEAEIYISEKIGVQLEYGFQLSLNDPNSSSLSLRERGHRNWLYQRTKGEVKYYTFQKKGFADFISLGLLHTPQSYLVRSEPVTLLNGQTVSLPNANMGTREVALFINYGGKIWFGHHFFMEYYFGAGFKKSVHRISNRPVLSSTSDESPVQYSFFSLEDRSRIEGDWHTLFIDFGIKCGHAF